MSFCLRDVNFNSALKKTETECFHAALITKIDRRH